jgi:hypothetical protein
MAWNLGMDEVRFEVAEWDAPAHGIIEAVTVVVNGRDLMEVVKEMEAPFAVRDGRPGPGGSYAGLPPEEVFLPSRRLLGEPETNYAMDDPDGRIAALGCACGEPGC